MNVLFFVFFLTKKMHVHLHHSTSWILQGRQRYFLSIFDKGKTDIDNPPIVIFMRHSDDQDSLKQFLK